MTGSFIWRELIIAIITRVIPHLRRKNYRKILWGYCIPPHPRFPLKIRGNQKYKRQNCNERCGGDDFRRLSSLNGKCIRELICCICRFRQFCLFSFRFLIFDKEVVAMDNEYIISFMIILLLLVISIKKITPTAKWMRYFLNNNFVA